MKKSHKILFWSVILILAIIGSYFGGLFSIISFGDWRDNEDYMTTTGDIALYYNTPISERTTMADDFRSNLFWDVKAIGETSYSDTGAKTNTYLGFPVTIKSKNYETINGKQYMLANYEITYNGVTKKVYNNRGTNNINDVVQNSLTYEPSNNRWALWSRSTGLTTYPDLGFETEISFDNGQLVFYTPKSYSGDGCAVRLYNFADNSCGDSKLYVKFQPQITIDEISIDRLINEPGFNKTVITITNNFGDFDGVLRFKVDFTALSGNTETLEVDQEVKILKGTHDYYVESASFLITANKVTVDIYSIQQDYQYVIGSKSSTGSNFLFTDYQKFYSLKQPPKIVLDSQGNIIQTVAGRNDLLKISSACERYEKPYPSSASTYCYQSFKVKKLVVSKEDTSLGEILTGLQLELKEKIEKVQELTGNIQAQTNLINSITTSLEEKTLIVANLDLTIQQQSALIDALSSTTDEQTQYITQLDATIQEKALIISNLELSITQQADIISSLTTKQEEQAQYISELNLNIQSQADMINALATNLEEKAYFISQLTAENEIQAQLIAQMEESFSNQGVIIDSLNKEITDDAVIIGSLTSRVEEQAQIILGMKATIEEMGQLVTELQTTNNEQALLISELTSVTEEQGQIIEGMKLSLQESADLIKTLTTKTDEQALMIKQLKLSLIDEKELVSELTDKIAEQEIILEELTNLKAKQQTMIYYIIGGSILIIAILGYMLYRKK